VCGNSVLVRCYCACHLPAAASLISDDMKALLRPSLALPAPAHIPWEWTQSTTAHGAPEDHVESAPAAQVPGRPHAAHHELVALLHGALVQRQRHLCRALARVMPCRRAHSASRSRHSTLPTDWGLGPVPARRTLLFGSRSCRSDSPLCQLLNNARSSTCRATAVRPASTSATSSIS